MTQHSASTRRSNCEDADKRRDKRWNYLPLHLFGVVIMVATALQEALSWAVDLVKGQRSNLDFVLYLVKSVMPDLPWRWHHSTKATTQESTSDIPRVIITTSCKPAFEDDDDELSTVASSKEWFLSDESFPTSTRAERMRFLKARNGNVEDASIMLSNYLEWRSKYDHDTTTTTTTTTVSRDGIDDDDDEEDPIWSSACRSAVATSLTTSSATLSTTPPCIVYMVDDFTDDCNNNNTIAQSSPHLRTVSGSRILQHLPARIDLTQADAELYATALALYIDRTLSRESTEKMCVVIDVRPGMGWSNIPAPKLVPFIQHVAKLLNELHPERLESCVLFPMPFVCAFLWNMVKAFLDPTTAHKICILSGSAKVDSPVPQDMTKHVRVEAVEWMEQKRKATFCTKEKKC